MNVEDVRGFLAVVDHGRVGAAADELGISQSCLLYTSDAADE